MRNLEKENEFYNKEFSFSYSSLNKLLFSPSLFYKDYVLFDREQKIEKYLIEGKLVHCILFEPDEVENKFSLVPGKTPSDNIRKVLLDMSFNTDAETLAICDDHVILDSLKNLNLFQSLKADESRIAKVRTEDNEPYWKFLGNTNVDVIDQDTLNKCTEYVQVIKANADVMELFRSSGSDFDLDPVTSYAEKMLSCKLKDKPFGLKGIVDYYKVDDDKKLITICDLKTTGKTLTDFEETVDFYKYWLQAAIYCKLVFENVTEEQQQYNFIYKFVVIDKFKQVYVFDVSQDTLSNWTSALSKIVKIAEYHYTKKNYSLPYEFLIKKVTL